MSYMIKEDLFAKTNLLEFGKRMFFMIFKTIVRNKNIEEMIDTFKDVPLTMNIQMDRAEKVKSQLEKKVSYGIDKFKNKLKVVNNAISKRKSQGNYNDSIRI